MHELNYLKRVPSESRPCGSNWRPLSPISTCGSENSGWGTSTSTMGLGASNTVLEPFLAFFAHGDSFGMFIIPHTTNMNTTEWTARPSVEGHPVGVAILDPKIRLTIRKVSGLAITKNVRAEMIEMTSLSCCFLPLHPQPQSLNKPILNSYYKLTKKTYLKFDRLV